MKLTKITYTSVILFLIFSISVIDLIDLIDAKKNQEHNHQYKKTKTIKKERLFQDLYINAGYGLLYALTNLAKWPILGLMLGPILGENLMWRKDPARLKAYINAGWLWVAMFTARLLIQYPLYKSGNINALGSARIIMGYPLFLATAWGTWQILRKTPTTKVV